jgi:predicted NUDIX family NTP pyrophosphohydrolase
MDKLSAGILLYRCKNGPLEVLIAHPGGPFWTKKDVGAWSIPKGLVEPGEDLLRAAIREFQEETGHHVSGEFLKLRPVKLRAGKIVIPFALEHDLDPETVLSNSFQTEWPPRSGRQQEFPEIDRVAWFGVETAKQKLNPAQAAFVDELVDKLREAGRC